MGSSGNLVYGREHGFPDNLARGREHGYPGNLADKRNAPPRASGFYWTETPRTRESGSLPQHGPDCARFFQKAGHPAPAVW